MEEKGLIVSGLKKHIKTLHSVPGSNRMRVIFRNYDSDDTAVFNLCYNDPTFSDIENDNLVWKLKDLNRSVYVDVDDYTGGKNAELKFFRSQAGPISNKVILHNPRGEETERKELEANSKPQQYLIEVYKSINAISPLDTLKFSLFSEVIVKGIANWTDHGLSSKKYVYKNEVVLINIVGLYGMYGQQITIRIYNEKDKSKVISEIIHKVEYPDITIPIEVESTFGIFGGSDKYYYSIYHHSFDQETLIHKSYHLLEVLKSVLVSRTKTDDFFSDLSGSTGSLSPVYILEDEFFSQRYEKCSYSKIKAFYNNSDQEFVLFDEENLLKGIKEVKKVFKVLDSGEGLSIKYQVEGLETAHCRNNPEYQLGGGQSTEAPHSEEIFNTYWLDEEQIKYEKSGNDTIEVYPTYNYYNGEQIIKDFTALSLSELAYFFFKYNPFVISKKWDEYSFRVKTCRYDKNFEFAVVPDINWAIHVFFFSPDENHLSDRFDQSKLYYRNYNELDLESVGIEKVKSLIEDYGSFVLQKWDIVNLDNAFYLRFLKDLGKGIHEMIVEFIVSYLTDKIEGFRLGMHAFLNYDARDKPNFIIDYTKEFDYIRVFYILVLALQQIAIEVIILILSRGALSKQVFKQGVKLAKVRKVLDKKGDIESVLEEVGIEVIYPQIGFQIGGGNQQVTKEQVSNILRFRIVAEPLIGIKIKDEISPGAIVKDLTGIGISFSALRLFGVDKLLGKLKKTGRLSKKVKANLEYIESSDFSNSLVTLEGEIVKNIDERISKLLGVEAKITMNANILYDFFAEIKVDIDKEEIEPIDKEFLDFSHNKITYGPKGTLSIRFEFDASVKNRIMMGLVNIYSSKKKESIEMRGEIEMGMIFERVYSYEALGEDSQTILIPGTPLATLHHVKQLVYQDTIIFTGAYGYFDVWNDNYSEKKSRSQKEEEFKSDKTPFEIFPPYTQVMPKQSVLPDEFKKII